MTYVPPAHILLRRHTDAITDGDLGYLEQALQRQLNDCAGFYGLPPPGVTLVAPDTHLPGAEAVAIDFVDNDGLDWAVAHHGWSDAAGFAWALVGVKETWSWQQAASHEALEYFLNLHLDRYALAPDGGLWPLEICDMVESHSYPMHVDRFGKGRTVLLSNYVLPSFWQAESRFPWDYLGLLTGPFTVAEGGYALVEREGVLAPLGSGAAQSARRSSSAERASSRARALQRQAGWR